MSSLDESGSPNRREEGSNAGCLALQSGEEVTTLWYDIADYAYLGAYEVNCC